MMVRDSAGWKSNVKIQKGLWMPAWRSNSTHVCLLMAISCMTASACLADESANDSEIETDHRPSRSVVRAQSATEEQFGLNSRVGFIAGQTVGRDNSIGHVELLPYMAFGDSSIALSDLRFFFDTEGQVGGNFGLGLRSLLGDGDRVAGGFVWYDFDETSGELFQQISTSLEVSSTGWDIFGNIYVPIGDTRQRYSISAANTRFSDNRLLFDQTETAGNALTGGDIEFGFLLPSQFAADHRLKAFAGGYHYSGDETDDVTGFMGRLEGNINNAIDAQVKVTSDDTFGTNVVAGISISLAGSFRDEGWQRKREFDRLTQFAHRSYNIIVPRSTTTTNGVAAVNSETGAAYSIQHVNSSATTGFAGTLANPFATISDAQAAGGDIILVHAGSQFSGQSIALHDGDRLFGEGDGIVNSLLVPEIGSLTLPATGSGTVRPVFTNAISDTFTLASNTEVSGLDFNFNSGGGIRGDSISNVTLRDVRVVSAADDAVLLTNASGTIELINSHFESSSGSAALNIDGGTADIVSNSTFTGGSLAPVIEIENTTGGSVDLRDAAIDGENNGIQLTNNSASLMFSDLSLTDSTIDINGGDSDITFAGTTSLVNAKIDIENFAGNTSFENVDITGSGGPAINLLNNTGITSFAALNINTTGGAGLIARNAGTVNVTSGSLSTGSHSAIDVADTAINMTLNSVNVQGADTGIRLVDTTGDFAIIGDGTGVDASGGSISDSTTGIVLQNTQNTTLRFLTLDNNDTAIQGNTLASLQIQDSTISNSNATAVDLTDAATVTIVNSTFTDNGTTNENTLSLTALTDNIYNWTVETSTLTGDAGSAIAVNSTVDATLNLNLQENVLTSTADGIDTVNIDWIGQSSIAFLANTFNVLGDNGTVVNVETSSTSDITRTDFIDNTLLLTGTGTTGLRLVNTNASTNLIERNTFQLANAGTGVDLTLSTDSNTGLIGNLIDGGTRGIWFRSIAGTSNIQIDSNLIDFSNLAGVTDEGLVFDSLSTGVTFFGSTNNFVQNASTPISITSGITSGSFFLNGLSVP